MNPLRAILLGTIQGVTEFLPISSSGHLVLVPWLLHWRDPGLVFDVTVHWGTLLAVIAYFYADIFSLSRAWWGSIRHRTPTRDPSSRLAWLILIGNVPAGLAVLFFGEFLESLFKRPIWAASFLLITGCILVASEWRLRSSLNREAAVPESTNPPHSGAASVMHLPVAGAVLIGVAQALAIAPGISRSGATIAAGLLIGLGRRESARFSFLLATPAIVGAGALQLADLLGSGAASTNVSLLAAGFIAAALTGYLAIRFLLNYLQQHTLYLFAAYCWAVGLFGFAVYWMR